MKPVGVYDRDYLPSSARRRRPTGLLSDARTWPATTWLVAYLLLQFVINARTNWLPLQHGSFSYDAAVTHHQFWRFLTAPFLQTDLIALAMNILFLAVFGPVVELCLGRPRFLALYLLSSLAGTLACAALVATHLADWSPATTLAGPAAGVFGVLAACACLAPETPVWFLPAETPITWNAAALIASAAMLLVVHRQGVGTGIGYTQTAGLAVGAALTQLPRIRDRFTRPRRRS